MDLWLPHQPKNHSSISRSPLPLFNLWKGAPQGGILSPIFFNLLIEQHINLHLHTQTTLCSYADHLQLITRGLQQILYAQHALDVIANTSNSICLKINPSKSSTISTPFQASRSSLHSMSNHWMDRQCQMPWTHFLRMLSPNWPISPFEEMHPIKNLHHEKTNLSQNWCWLQNSLNLLYHSHSSST